MVDPLKWIPRQRLTNKAASVSRAKSTFNLGHLKDIIV